MGLGMSHISIAYIEFKKFNKSENILNRPLLKKDKLVKKNKKCFINLYGKRTIKAM